MKKALDKQKVIAPAKLFKQMTDARKGAAADGVKVTLDPKDPLKKYLAKR